jgi:hypothetical protein
VIGWTRLRVCLIVISAHVPWLDLAHVAPAFKQRPNNSEMSVRSYQGDPTVGDLLSRWSQRSRVDAG